MVAKGLTVDDVVCFIEALYPPDRAESWDQVGLITGNRSSEVKRILLAVDAVEDVVDQAVSDGCDLLITHHPLFLRGTSSVSEDTSKGRMIAKLIRADCAMFCAHTNADVAQDGVAAALGELLGLGNCQPMVKGEDPAIGLGRVGSVAEQTLESFAAHVADKLPAGPTGIFVGGDLSRVVSRVAVSGGSGDSLFADATDCGADVFVTADLRHHPAQDHLRDPGPALICGSHWATEWPWLPRLKKILIDEFASKRDSLNVDISTIVTEPWIQHMPTRGLCEDESPTPGAKAATGRTAS